MVKHEAIAEIQRIMLEHALTVDDLSDIDQALQAERAAARRGALAAARRLVEFWDMQPAELSGGVARRPVDAPPPAPAAAPVKYEHPLTGEVWDGEGAQPDWLRRALLTDGYRVVELKPGTDEFNAVRQRHQAA